MSAFRFGDDYRLNLDESHQGDDYLPSWDEIDWSNVDWVEIEGERFEAVRDELLDPIVQKDYGHYYYICPKCRSSLGRGIHYCSTCGAHIKYFGG